VLEGLSRVDVGYVVTLSGNIDQHGNTSFF
jgi:hypothetical protein